MGRVGNRIREGAFSLNGQSYQLTINNGPNSLHGGANGWNKKPWSSAGPATDAQGDPCITFSLTSPDGDEGYPGEVAASVTYTLRPGAELEARMTATTAGPHTPINMVQHTYFNLAGAATGTTILDHVLHMPTASHFTPVDENLIPTGAIQAVHGTPMDFTSPRAIGERMAEVEGTATQGYDHNYVLHGFGEQAAAKCAAPGGLLPAADVRRVARAEHTASGRFLELHSNAPGVQLYSGNFLGGEKGKDGATYARHAGFCLETQTFPDGVNRRGAFPDPVIAADSSSTYDHRWIVRFGKL